MNIIKKVEPEDVIGLFQGRDGKHVRDMLLGAPCGHRKYGVEYDTYDTIKSFWEVPIMGKYTRISFFGFLKTCDMCKKKMIRWPSWEPEILA